MKWGKGSRHRHPRQRRRGTLGGGSEGAVASDQQQGNYFLGALGELVQRMDDPNARYALALPDNRRYRGLVARLPELARLRLNLTILFVSDDGEVTEVLPSTPSHVWQR